MKSNVYWILIYSREFDRQICPLHSAFTVSIWAISSRLNICYPRDAILAQHLLPSRVRPFVCHKPALYQRLNGQEGRTTWLCQISSKSLKPRPRFVNFSIFQDEGRRHFGFLKSEIFNGRARRECRTLLPSQISWRSVRQLPRYRDSIF